MADFEIDISDFNRGIEKLNRDFGNNNKRGVADIAHEIMRLSQFQVPHDTGLLQNSGQVESSGDDQIVGYNKVYAARLHEHPEYRFQKGRKGKYLEDPIKNNLDILLKVYADSFGGMF